MRWFDFLRRKRNDPAHSSSADLLEPRCHHYTFAHYALRMAAFDRPLMFLAIVGSDKAQSFFLTLMKSVSEHCAQRGQMPDFGVEDISVQKLRVGSYPCAVIQMPPPKAVTETYFVAAVLLCDLTKDKPDDEEKEFPLRYFTLEKGAALNGPPRTVLCEWTRDGAHVNYGDGPEANLEALSKALEAKLSIAH